MRTTKRVIAAVIAVAALPAMAYGQPPAEASALLNHLVGKWVLRGTIDGNATTHDLDAAWVLNREYLQLHELSRETDSAGRPGYEAIVLIGWNPRSAEYACLWLDSTSGEGLANNIIAHGKPVGDSIPFIFNISPNETFHNTFAYDRATDSWRWTLDGEQDGKTAPFARLTLTRK